MALTCVHLGEGGGKGSGGGEGFSVAHLLHTS